MDKKEIPATMTYTLTWDCPRRAEMAAKAGFSPKFTFSIAFPLG
jgi:hypothetical protein